MANAWIENATDVCCGLAVTEWNIAIERDIARNFLSELATTKNLVQCYQLRILTSSEVASVLLAHFQTLLSNHYQRNFDGELKAYADRIEAALLFEAGDINRNSRA